MMIFGLILFLLMVMMGGLALDLMRYEAKRTALQQTNDRATLAAASFTNTIPPVTVVNDYYDKAGLSEYLTGVQVDQGLNYKTISATATADTHPFFLHMMGINDFDAHSYSVAEQRINNVEIMLVLDVSGSMGGAKIANLKTAAKEFVDTVLANDTENRISIGIVPYNAQVNLGPTLRGKYNATYQHGVANVNCLEVPVSAYSSATLPRDLPIPMYAYADVLNENNGSAYVNKSTSYVSRTDSTATASNFWCNPTTVNVVRLPMRNPTTLKANIDALQAGGNTSIMLGMKWGLTLLDPGARPMFNELIAANQIPSIFSGRPFDWTDEDSMKVIVLMTDGEHVSHFKVNDDYKTALSPIWRSSGDGNYSIRFTSGRPTAAGTNQYWVPHLCTSSSCRNGSNTAQAWQATPYNSAVNGSTATQLSWNAVWAAQRQTWVAWQLYARALGTSTSTRNTAYSNAMTAFQSQFASESAMDTQLQQSCTLAKNNKVQVFGIAFEAPANGQTQIRNCATSTSHYWDANGLEIQTAFRAIASQISLLRLTQ